MEIQVPQSVPTEPQQRPLPTPEQINKAKLVKWGFIGLLGISGVLAVLDSSRIILYGAASVGSVVDAIIFHNKAKNMEARIRFNEMKLKRTKQV